MFGLPLNLSRRELLWAFASAGIFMGRGAWGLAQSPIESQEASSSEPESALANLKEDLSGWMEEFGVPGVSIALIQNGTFVSTVHDGVLERGGSKTVDEATVFEAASLTKPITAYLALKLIEEGKLSLDTPLVEHIPDPFPTKQTEWLPLITVEHVLRHTSGLPNWGFTPPSVLIRSKPGEQFAYSGDGFRWLQRVIEKLRGESLDVIAKDRLFDPLGMESAGLVWREDYGERLAHGHREGLKKTTLRRMPTASAASTLVCNAGDYARFVQCLLNPPEPDENFLRPESIATMFKPGETVVDGIAWGLGWGLADSGKGRSFWHWGNNNNLYHAFVAGYPETGDGIVILTNSGGGLRLSENVVEVILTDRHPAFGWPMVIYR